MGWLRFVGSLKLQVSFAEYPLFKRALLQKRYTSLRSLQIVANPYAIVLLLQGGEVSRLLQIIGRFCKRALKKRRYSAKESYNFKEPTNRSNPVCNVALATGWRRPIACFKLQVIFRKRATKYMAVLLMK